MLNLAVGIIAVSLGLWGVMRNWYMFVDIIGAVIPLALIGLGIVAFLAGIRSIKER